MPIPKHIKIKNKALPDNPGVYLYYSRSRELLYIGKATSLKKRVGSYFSRKYQKADDLYSRRIGKMVSEIARIDYIETPTVIEALVLEANLIRVKKPKVNRMLTDDKSFLYLVFTNEDYPKPLFVRGLELLRKGYRPFETGKDSGSEEYLAVYGPFTSSMALKNALELLRRIFPYSTCGPPREGKKPRACFYAHIRQCPGVCTGKVLKRDYRKNIRGLMQFFDGKKTPLIKRLEREMLMASKAQRYEDAGALKKQIKGLEHIRDVSIITKDFSPLPYENPDKGYVDALGRVEAYDISNISGTDAVGSMVVFEKGRANKSLYRKFGIKTVKGANDVAMMKEVVTRRLKRAERYPKAWPLPDVMVIDGGKPQVNAVQGVMEEFGLGIPVIGLAKGPDRKQDVLVYDKTNKEVARVARAHKETFQKARDEAHRFAVSFHRVRRRKRHKKN